MLMLHFSPNLVLYVRTTRGWTQNVTARDLVIFYVHFFPLARVSYPPNISLPRDSEAWKTCFPWWDTRQADSSFLTSVDGRLDLCDRASDIILFIIWRKRGPNYARMYIKHGLKMSISTADLYRMIVWTIRLVSYITALFLSTSSVWWRLSVIVELITINGALAYLVLGTNSPLPTSPDFWGAPLDRALNVTPKNWEKIGQFLWFSRAQRQKACMIKYARMRLSLFYS